MVAHCLEVYGLPQPAQEQFQAEWLCRVGLEASDLMLLNELHMPGKLYKRFRQDIYSSGRGRQVHPPECRQCRLHHPPPSRGVPHNLQVPIGSCSFDLAERRLPPLWPLH